MSFAPKRITGWSLALALLCFAAGEVAADDGERGRPAPQQPKECVKVSTEARYAAYGYDHLVDVTNGCDKAMTCDVSTNVNPTPTTVEVAVGETKTVLTYRGSPAREFSAKVDCKPQ